MTATEAPPRSRHFRRPAEEYDACPDHADLASLGYEQGSDRTLGSFSPFAAVRLDTAPPARRTAPDRAG